MLSLARRSSHLAPNGGNQGLKKSPVTRNLERQSRTLKQRRRPKKYRVVLLLIVLTIERVWQLWRLTHGHQRLLDFKTLRNHWIL
ncbi:uncharacterized protein ACOB8E_012023 isoform 2-T2 [Sarcophilus harrisii]